MIRRSIIQEDRVEGEEQLSLGVIGLGHVGLPTAVGLADLGWSVVGADDDRAKAETIASGRSPFYEPDLDECLARQLASGRFQVAPDVPSAIRAATVLFVCVGTPQRPDGAADLSQVDHVARTISSHLNGYKLIVEKSTAPVRTAQQLKASIGRYVESSNAKTGSSSGESEVDIAVNPEFLREGSALQDFLHPDRIVLGVASERAREILVRIYKPLLDRSGLDGESSVVVTDVNTAEIIKHASNGFLATKISYINMVADLCDATGANVDTVARGIGLDPRIGGHFLKAGLGYGGYCLPKDLRSFAWMTEENGVDSALLREVERINSVRIDRFLAKVKKAIWVVKGKTVAVWGLAFKPGTDDVREASSIDVVGRLLEEGARLRLHDPRSMAGFESHFAADPPGLVYCQSPEEAAEGADAILLLTEWPEYLEVDWPRVREHVAGPVIVDGRNLFDADEVRCLGFDYYGVGKP